MHTGRASQTPATLADIAPTLHALTALDDPPETDGLDLSPWLMETVSLNHGHAHSRLVTCSTATTAGPSFGRITSTSCTQGRAGRNLQFASDPMELNNIAADADTAVYLNQLVVAHKLEPKRAGHGLRVRVSGDPSLSSVEVTLGTACSEAGVFDPELLVERRANLEWGESARKVREDVGAVSQSEDGKTLRFTPGPQPQGTLWLRCDVSPSLDAVAVTINGVAQTGEPKGRGVRFASKEGKRTSCLGMYLSHPVASSLECKNGGNDRPTKATSRFWSHSATSATRRMTSRICFTRVWTTVGSVAAGLLRIGCAAAQPDTTVAKVGDKEITRSDLDAAAAAKCSPCDCRSRSLSRPPPAVDSRRPVQARGRTSWDHGRAAGRARGHQHIDEPTEEMLRDVYQQHQADLG